MRPHQFLSKHEINVFEGGIEPNDILQGKLGDCYFLCALSSMAENEDRIKRLFIDENSSDSLE